MRSRAFLAALAIGVVVAQIAGAAPTEQKYGYSPESFEIKFYLQPRYNYMVSGDNAGDNAFGVRRARFYLTSAVAPNIKGRLQVSAVPDKVELLDAYLEWTPWMAKYPAFSLTMGSLKKPFSYQEFVMSSSDLNLIDRTYVNGVLEKKLFASSYDLGMMATADLRKHDVPLLLNLGVFNGNGPGNKADGNRGKQIVCRGEVTPVTGLTLGGNAAMNRLDVFEVAGGDTTQSGKGFLVWGGDVLFQHGKLRILGEVIGGDNYEPVVTLAAAKKHVNFEAPSFLGLYGEAVYLTANGWQPAARVERFDPNTDVDNDGQLLLTGQIAKVFSPNFRWQVNLVHTEYEAQGKDADDELVTQWTVKL
jgi:hypothetical protein